MLAGNPSRFAIQIELDQPIDREWLFGRMWFHAGGTVVGKSNESSSLVVGFSCLKNILANAGKRTSDRLIALPATALFSEIETALFVDDSRSDDELKRDVDAYSPFIALPMGFDLFDRWLAFLVEDDVRARFVWSTLPREQPPQEVWLRRGEVDAVIMEALAFADALPLRS